MNTNIQFNSIYLVTIYRYIQLASYVHEIFVINIKY